MISKSNIKKEKTISIAAFVMAVFLMLGTVLVPSLVFAEPTSEPKSTSGKTESSSKSSTTKPGNEKESKTKTDDKKSKQGNKDKDDKDDENDEDIDEENDDAEAAPSPTKNPRLDENGRPVLAERENAILVDSRTGEVLFEQNADARIFPASTTKIMTALLVLEAIERGDLNLNAAFLITPDMLENLAIDGSSMSLKEGEAMTVQYLLEGLLIQSGNDAAQALAIIVCGDVETFVQRMNNKADELELEDTHFMNPHGLHDEEHYTTAADMCRITVEAMKNKTFRNIVSMARATIPATEKTGVRTITNTNGLLSTLRYINFYYNNATGVKTGHTSEAGYCLVSSAKKGDFEVVAVVMNAETDDDRHYDSRNLLEYAIDNFKMLTPIKRDDMLSEIKVRFGSGIDHTTLSAAKDMTVTVPADTESEELEVRFVMPDYIAAPIEAGEKVGTVEVVLSGKVVGTGDLIADMTVKRHPLGFLMQFFAFIWGFWFVKITVVVLVAAVIILVVYMAVNIRRNLKQARRDRRHRF